MMENKKKKIVGVVTTNRADYGRLKPIMDKINKNDQLELKTIVGTSLFVDNFLLNLKHANHDSIVKSLPWYLKARLLVIWGGKKAKDNVEYLTKQIKKDGFNIDARIPFFIPGGSLDHMVKSAGLALFNAPKALRQISPDILLIHGDRFELLPIVMAGSYMNIPIAHIEGGDISGTIDNSIRHSITKLSHIHFPSTEDSKNRLIRMGENKKDIFVVGSPIIDYLKLLNLNVDNSVFDRCGREGGEIDLTKPYLLVIYHPVTTEYEENEKHTQAVVDAIKELNIPTFILSSNIDGGSNSVESVFKNFRENKKQQHGVVFRKNLFPEDFYKVLANARVVVGNSSSFIKEAGYLGVPSVIVGSRQQNREKGDNVIEVEPKKDQIISAVKKQIKHGYYKQSLIFGSGNTSDLISEIISNIDLQKINIQKIFVD